jgi:hypothetical protein
LHEEDLMICDEKKAFMYQVKSGGKIWKFLIKQMLYLKVLSFNFISIRKLQETPLNTGTAPDLKEESTNYRCRSQPHPKVEDITSTKMPIQNRRFFILPLC